MLWISKFLTHGHTDKYFRAGVENEWLHMVLFICQESQQGCGQKPTLGHSRPTGSTAKTTFCWREHSVAQCVKTAKPTACVSVRECVRECVFGSGQSQDTDGMNGVSRSVSSGQITPMLFLLGSLVGGHRQSWPDLDYLTLGHRMRQQGSRTDTQQVCCCLCLPVRWRKNLL